MATANLYKNLSTKNNGIFFSISKKQEDGSWKSTIVSNDPAVEEKFNKAMELGFGHFSVKGTPFVVIDEDKSVTEEMDGKVRLVSFTLA